MRQPCHVNHKHPAVWRYFLSHYHFTHEEPAHEHQSLFGIPRLTSPGPSPHASTTASRPPRAAHLQARLFSLPGCAVNNIPSGFRWMWDGSHFYTADHHLLSGYPFNCRQLSVSAAAQTETELIGGTCWALSRFCRRVWKQARLPQCNTSFSGLSFPRFEAEDSGRPL